ncbi:MAG: hypothetical protein HYZ42_17450 [Bacteroidetes bacterium]|nr:hypothetical protein [Bacteroidota bacterium]
MKKLFILLSITALIACNSKPKSETPAEPISNTEAVTQDQPAATEDPSSELNPMEAFAGTWSQDPLKETEAKSALSLAKMELDLNADGTFEGKSEMMGKNNTVQGTWKLTGNTVELEWDGTLLSLVADASMKQISDMKNGVILTK